MTDVALKRIDFPPDNPPRFDLVLNGGDLVIDAGLETAVVLSLFTDRRAQTDDEIPDGTDDRRGWWADTFSDVEGDRIGSRLWLLAREKDTASTLERAREFAEEALDWMIEDGVAKNLTVVSERVRPGVLGLAVSIERAAGGRWDTVWEAHVNAV